MTASEKNDRNERIANLKILFLALGYDDRSAYLAAVQESADIVDGYNRDDLGESPDY